MWDTAPPLSRAYQGVDWRGITDVYKVVGWDESLASDWLAPTPRLSLAYYFWSRGYGVMRMEDQGQFEEGLVCHSD